jgi:hypothetical protein
MRPVPVVVAVLSIGLLVFGVNWLGQSVTGIDESTGDVRTPIQDEPDFPVPSESGPHPKVEFAELEHNFGTKPRHSKGSHKFIVKNTGEATLKLKAGRTTCQCTVGEVGGNEIAPGESTTIELSWTIKQAGPGFQHSAQIHTNDPKNPTETLVVKGFIGVDVALWPEDRWSMGTLKVDGKATFNGFVFSHISENFDIVKVENNTPGLNFKTERLTEDELQSIGAMLISDSAEPPDPHGTAPKLEHPELKSGYRIIVTADNRIPVGQFLIPVRIHTTLAAVPTITTAVTGVRPGPYQFFPLPGSSYRPGSMMIDAGPLVSSKEHSAGLLVICRGFDGELKLEDVVTDPEWLNVDLKPAPGEGTLRRYHLTLQFPKGLPPMNRTSANPATLQIKTNHPDAGVLNLKAAFVVKE